MGNSQGMSTSNSRSCDKGQNNQEATNIDFSGQKHNTTQDIKPKTDVAVNSGNSGSSLFCDSGKKQRHT